MCSFLAAQQQTESFTTAPRIKTNPKAGGTTHIADTFFSQKFQTNKVSSQQTQEVLWSLIAIQPNSLSFASIWASRGENLDIYVSNKHLIPSAAGMLALYLHTEWDFSHAALLRPEKLLGSMSLVVGRAWEHKKSLKKIVNMPLEKKNQIRLLAPGIHICKSTFIWWFYTNIGYKALEKKKNQIPLPSITICSFTVTQ